ncbi:MAG: nitric-oxide reductase large subunit [Deltaproteobacteria bacterium]|nr:nitric-oxide reductase large subunit [Deltaproteobacteria bacterium]
MRHTKLWFSLGAVMLVAFTVLGYFGREIYRQAPPIPLRVVTTTGTVLFTGDDIRNGQNVWQSLGGQEVGSIWGHGAYVAPDWSADWLHREATWLLDAWAQGQYQKAHAALDEETQAALRARLKREMRTNTYNPVTEDLLVSPARAEAIAAVGHHYAALFGNDPQLAALRDAYALPERALKDPERQRLLNAFFFWTAWACATNRPGGVISYTNNWPPESLIDNVPTAAIFVWSVVSIVLLLAGIGALTWYIAARNHAEGVTSHAVPENDPLRGLAPTPSMQATVKYFWVVAALLVLQVLLGVVTAHFAVEGTRLYGFPLAQWLPYAVTRTWHVQLGIFWIATAWLATGFFIAPAVSGYEPPYQRLGVNFVFVCLLIIVVGSMAGQWFGVQQRLGLVTNFWFGHQGYEYVDLGRFWQLFLLVGLILWLVLMDRPMRRALRNADQERDLLVVFFIASVAIPLFYAAGIMWGRHTNLAIVEYWRWWVVHLWVEGFFEVFATVVLAFLFSRLGLVSTVAATRTVLFSTAIYLTGGIIGTFHHLYFTGTPTAILALGATFSALEVVPLVLIGYEAYGNLTLSRLQPWVSAYQWPIYFFVAVGFWNLVGAGLFGFLINPPIALYYMQGLNTTPLHAHTAFFGVYGMLGIGLMLFCLRGLTEQRVWKNGLLAFAFWAMNIGLLLMALLSLLPIGLLQTWASVEHGLWYARSAEFLQTDTMTTLRWLRMIGDTIFACGTLALGWFVLGLKFGWSLTSEAEPGRRPVTASAVEGSS